MIHGLKTKLGVNLAFFLLLAILLTDFVLIRIVESQLIQQRVEYGSQLIEELTSNFFNSPTSGHWRIGSQGHEGLAPAHPFLAYGLFHQAGKDSALGEPPPHIKNEMVRANEKAISTGSPQHFFTGNTWGVFWKQNKYLVISEPILKIHPTGAITLFIQLEDIYHNLRESQKLIFFYALANLFLLTGFAVFRFSRIVVRPIQRFIRLTEQVRSTDQFPAYPDRHNHEFSRLSNAIHQMGRRIEMDKEKIQNSLNSLEIAHNDLKKTQKEMVRAEKLASVGRLSAGIAHEIGNPIGIVLGYLGLLKRQSCVQAGSKELDYIERAEFEISRINNIIRQLLDFSRTAPGEKSVLSIHALIQDVGGMISDQPLMQNIAMSYHLCAADDQVYGDYQQLRQVLVNLLINAADSIRLSGNSEAGRVQLQTRQIDAQDSAVIGRSPTIEIVVADNGAGIASEEIDNIFDPFYTTKEPGKGTGLGLSVSYMIIEQFGGTIEARSEVNQGTAMSIYLNLVEGPSFQISEKEGVADEPENFTQHSHS